MIECKVNAACKVVLRVDSVLVSSRGSTQPGICKQRAPGDWGLCWEKPTFGQLSRRGWIQLQGCPRPHPFTLLAGLANTWTMCQQFIHVSTTNFGMERCLQDDVSCLHLSRWLWLLHCSLGQDTHQSSSLGSTCIFGQPFSQAWTRRMVNCCPAEDITIFLPILQLEGALAVFLLFFWQNSGALSEKTQGWDSWPHFDWVF